MDGWPWQRFVAEWGVLMQPKKPLSNDVRHSSLVNWLIHFVIPMRIKMSSCLQKSMLYKRYQFFMGQGYEQKYTIFFIYKIFQSENVLKDVPWYRSARIMLALVSAWGYVFFYVLRIDLSLAIVCMMKDPHQVWNGSTSDNSTHWYRNESEFNRSFTDLAVKQCGDTGRSGKKSYKVRGRILLLIE